MNEKNEKPAPAAETPVDAPTDGFPPEKDVSTPPPGTDQAPHPDKKNKDP